MEQGESYGFVEKRNSAARAMLSERTTYRVAVLAPVMSQHRRRTVLRNLRSSTRM